MSILINNGRIIDPSRGIDRVGDLAISGDFISDSSVFPDNPIVMDASSCWVVPGLIDAHVHLREPGQEHKEDILSGLSAAAAGGFTGVLPMPNTSPPNDLPEIVEMMIRRAKELGGTRIYPVAAATKGRKGKQVGDSGALRAAGAVGFSDDGDTVADSGVMEQVLTVCRGLGVPFAQHAQDPLLSKDGVVHEGQISRKLGLPGWPSEAEDSIVARDIELVRKTGAHLHVSHISTRGAVALVRKAKAEKLPVTAEVTPHHLLLTDEIAMEAGPLAKVNPPLRTNDDVAACRDGLSDGTIDIIATDHAPHTVQDKEGGFIKAAFGMVGLETAVPLILLLVQDNTITPFRMIEAMSTAPAKLFALPGGTLAPGSPGDVTIIDPAASHAIDTAQFLSKGRNTPFHGRKVPGRAITTIVGGKVIFQSA